jgi:hypothetical protein
VRFLAGVHRKREIYRFFAISMMKKAWLVLPVLFFLCHFSASAQKTDSLRKDSLKSDTLLINKLRALPDKDAFPLRARPVLLQPELVPVTLPDYTFSYWHKAITFNLNFSQAAFTSNWTGGGVSSVALNSNFDFKAEYNKTPLDYTTELNLVYGTSVVKGQGTRKTNDLIYYDNKIATQLSKKWLFFGSLNFQSQFTNGYNYPSDTVPAQKISGFMAPGYLTESLGFEFKPNKYFDLRLGTGTARQTFVLDTTIYHNLPTNYGVTPGHTFLNQLAFQAVATIDKDIMPNVHINARYTLFIPYQQSLAYITHRVDATLTAKVNKMIAMTFNGTFLYDKNTAPQPQGTETLGLGVVYKFP